MRGVLGSPGRLLFMATFPSHFPPRVQHSGMPLESVFRRNDVSKHANRSENQERRERWPMS